MRHSSRQHQPWVEGLYVSEERVSSRAAGDLPLLLPASMSRRGSLGFRSRTPCCQTLTRKSGGGNEGLSGQQKSIEVVTTFETLTETLG